MKQTSSHLQLSTGRTRSRSELITSADIRRQLRAMVTEAGSVRVVSAQLGVSAQFLHDVLNERRELGRRILAALHLERIDGYRQIEGQ